MLLAGTCPGHDEEGRFLRVVGNYALRTSCRLLVEIHTLHTTTRHTL